MDINEIQKSRFNEIEASVAVLFYYFKDKSNDEFVNKELDKLMELIKSEKENREKMNDVLWLLANKF